MQRGPGQLPILARLHQRKSPFQLTRCVHPSLCGTQLFLNMALELASMGLTARMCVSIPLTVGLLLTVPPQRRAMGPRLDGRPRRPDRIRRRLLECSRVVSLSRYAHPPAAHIVSYVCAY